MLADRNEEVAKEAARQLGFARSTGDWRALVTDPAVDVVAITAPNALHKPIALAALQPASTSIARSRLRPILPTRKRWPMRRESPDGVTVVGFNYLKNPIIGLAREIVASGEIGELIAFRGIHAEDYMVDPEAPLQLSHRPGRRRRADGSRQPHRLACPPSGRAIAEVSAATATAQDAARRPRDRKPVTIDDHAMSSRGSRTARSARSPRAGFRPDERCSLISS